MFTLGKKKGFTITELVIVIVVIAILAAVLIPTFASLIKKANLSSDVQAARQMNVALAAESAVEKPDSLQEVIEILEEAGYDAAGSLKPITKNHKFYWYSTYNTIILVNEEEGAEKPVVFPTNNDDIIENFAADKLKTGDDQVLFDLEVGFRSFVRVDVTDAKTATDSLSNGQSVKLTENVKFETQPRIPAGATTTLDLGGKTVTTAQASGRSKYIEVDGTLIIENGTFSGRGIQVNDGGKLVIGKDANIVINTVDANGGAAVYVYPGGEVVIDAGKFVTTQGTNVATKGAAALINNGGNVVINGGEFVSTTGVYAITHQAGTTTINGGTITATRGALCASSGTVTVNNGKFTVTQDVGSGWAAYTEGDGKIVINGGQFSTVANRMFTGNVVDKR